MGFARDRAACSREPSRKCMAHTHLALLIIQFGNNGRGDGRRRSHAAGAEAGWAHGPKKLFAQSCCESTRCRFRAQLASFNFSNALICAVASSVPHGFNRSRRDRARFTDFILRISSSFGHPWFRAGLQRARKSVRPAGRRFGAIERSITSRPPSHRPTGPRSARPAADRPMAASNSCPGRRN
jgi:hypothetical protein